MRMRHKLGDLPEDRELVIDYPLQKPEQKVFEKNIKEELKAKWEKIRFQEHYRVAFTAPGTQVIRSAISADVYTHLSYWDFHVRQAVPALVNIGLYSDTDFLTGLKFDFSAGDSDKFVFHLPLSSSQPGHALRIYCSGVAEISGMIVGWHDYDRFPVIMPVRY